MVFQLTSVSRVRVRRPLCLYITNVWVTWHDAGHVTNLRVSPSTFLSGGSKVIRGIIARKEGEPGNGASVEPELMIQTIPAWAGHGYRKLITHAYYLSWCLPFCLIPFRITKCAHVPFRRIVSY